MPNNIGNYEKDPKKRSDARKVRINASLKFNEKWKAIGFVERLLSATYGPLGLTTYLLNHFLLMDLDDINYIMGSFFQGLNRREYSVLMMRFSNQLILKEVGMILDVGGERIRQTESAALRKLRHPLRSMRIKNLLLPEELYEIKKYDSLDEIEKDKWLIEKVKEYDTAKASQIKKNFVDKFLGTH